jgi:hypothetical protein
VLWQGFRLREGLDAAVRSSAATLRVGTNHDTVRVSGTAAVATLELGDPAAVTQYFHGATLRLIAGDGWSTGETGNIRPKTTAPRAVGAVVTLTYDAIAGLWREP